MKNNHFLNKVINNTCGVVNRIRKPNPIKEWPTTVISDKMGCDRGTPIDRVYIEKFLLKNSKYITGNVMEIGDNEYTLKYGHSVEKSIIFTADEQFAAINDNVICGDLQTGIGCKGEIVDCFILTQTLPFIFDVDSVIHNIFKMLKKDGTALFTVSGISMISRFDDSRWGHYWGFTETSLKKLFECYVESDKIEFVTMGNPKTASAFLYGLSVEDLSENDFEENDPLIPLMIGVVVHK